MNKLFRIRSILALLLVLVITVSLTGCKKSEDEGNASDESVEILLVTDYGTVNDGSYNQGAWDGIQMYANEHNVLNNHYQPASPSKESLLEEIKHGIKNNAKVVVCPGYLFEEAVFEAQSKYSDTYFVLLDGKPHNEDFTDESINNNTLSICFAEEEAGFLAGYAAVRDGYTNLGFIGGIPEESVIRYGYGFVQGADYAAIEMGVDVHIRYTYANTFADNSMVETLATTWYNDDTEVIFACGGELGRSVIRAAEANDGKVIGVDVDQSAESNVVITSAMKSLSTAVYLALNDYSNGAFEGGTIKRYTAKENGVCLPMDTSRFERFTEDDYESIYSRIVNGMIVPYNETNIGTTQELTLINTTVTYINI